MSENSKTERYMVYGSGQGNPEILKECLIERDLEYFQGMYPMRMKRLQQYVIQECDRLDYKNSPIYDEYPDRVMVNQLCDSICTKIMSEDTLRSEVEPLCTAGMVSAEREASEVEEVEVYELPDIRQVMGPGPVLPPWNESPQGPNPAQPSWNEPPQGPGSALPPWRQPPQGPGPAQPSWNEPLQGPGPALPPWRQPPQGPGPALPPWGPPPQDPGPALPPWGPPSRPPRPQPPRPPKPSRPSGPNWLNDVVKLLLLNELQHRRCRTRRC